MILLLLLCFLVSCCMAAQSYERRQAKARAAWRQHDRRVRERLGTLTAYEIEEAKMLAEDQACRAAANASKRAIVLGFLGVGMLAIAGRTAWSALHGEPLSTVVSAATVFGLIGALLLYRALVFWRQGSLRVAEGPDGQAMTKSEVGTIALGMLWGLMALLRWLHGG